MKTIRILLLAIISIVITKSSVSQNFVHEKGYVIYDENGIARTVMNLKISDYSGSTQSIANQLLMIISIGCVLVKVAVLI